MRRGEKVRRRKNQKHFTSDFATAHLFIFLPFAIKINNPSKAWLYKGMQGMKYVNFKHKEGWEIPGHSLTESWDSPLQNHHLRIRGVGVYESRALLWGLKSQNSEVWRKGSLCLARSGHLSLHRVPSSHLRGQNRKFCSRSWEENLLVPKALKFRTCPLPHFLSKKQPGLRLTGKEMRCTLGSVPLI